MEDDNHEDNDRDLLALMLGEAGIVGEPDEDDGWIDGVVEDWDM